MAYFVNSGLEYYSSIQPTKGAGGGLFGGSRRSDFGFGSHSLFGGVPSSLFVGGLPPCDCAGRYTATLTQKLSSSGLLASRRQGELTLSQLFAQMEDFEIIPLKWTGEHHNCVRNKLAKSADLRAQFKNTAAFLRQKIRPPCLECVKMGCGDNDSTCNHSTSGA